MTYKEIFTAIGVPNHSKLTISDRITIQENAMIAYLAKAGHLPPNVKDISFSRLACLCARELESR